MKNRRIQCVLSVLLTATVLVFALGRPTGAYVEKLYTLKEVMDESTNIAEGVIESLDPKTKIMVVKILGNLKGKCPLPQIKMNLNGGQEYYTEAMMKQAKVGEPVVVFYKGDAGGVQSECYTNNFFFQFNGNLNPKDAWSFTHIEIKMNRTFNGPVQSLVSVLKDVIAGKIQPPPPDTKLPPLTRSELMGLGAAPGVVSDDADGYEAYPEWKGEEWANPTEGGAVDYVDPGAPPDPGPQPGLLSEYYFIGQTIPDFPDVKGIPPTVKRIDKQINIENSSAPVPGTELATNFYVRWTGLVRIPKDGKYKFYTATDDGSRLLLDGKLLVDNGGDHGTVEKGGEVELKAGDHDFKMEYWQNAGPFECKAYWEGQGIAKAIIPPEILFHKGSISVRGQVLKIKLAEGAKGKLALTRALEDDFSKAPRMLFEAENLSAKTVKVAWAFQMKDGQFYESIPVDVSPGKWHYGLQVNFTLSNFKTKASDWKNTAEWANRNGVGRLTVLVYDSPATGTLNIDRVRMEKGASFVRSIPLAAAGGRGVSFADFDGDGNLDVLLCSEGGNRLYQNRGNVFTDVTAAVGLTGGSRTAAWADIDGDGKLDLLCGTPALWSFQNGKFVNNTKLLPLPAQSLECVGFVDANGDGKTDVLVAKGDAGLQLLLNEGKSFKDATKEFGITSPLGAGKRNLFTLANLGDDYTSVLCNQGKGVLLRCDEGKTFKVVTNSKIEYVTPGTMGVAFGDYDNDGLFDLFIPQAGKSILLHNNNDGTFTNATETSGALANVPPNARSAAWADVNMDGNLDLVIGFSDSPAMVFMGNGKGKFVPSPFSLAGFDCAYGVTGIAFGDFDNDGDLDMLVMGEKGAGIIVNETPRNDYVPLRVRPLLKSAPGMLVRLYESKEKGQEGRILGIRQPGLVSNIGSQDPYEAYFVVPAGAAAAPAKYKIAVLFTDGESRENVVTVGKDGLIWNIEEQKKK